MATASATVRNLSWAASAPISGPSSSTSRRWAQTVRTIVALPTPSGPDTSTPSWAVAFRVSQQLRLVERQLEPFGELAGLHVAAFEIVERHRRLGGAGAVAAFARGGDTAAVGAAAAGVVSAPVDQLTTELGCTLTGPAGSTALTVSSSEVQVIPTAVASAALACEVEVPGPRSRGSSDTVSPTVITLPSSACRSVAGGTERDARFEPVTVTDRAP